MRRSRVFLIVLSAYVCGTLACGVASRSTTPADVAKAWVQCTQRADAEAFLNIVSSTVRAQLEGAGRLVSKSISDAAKLMLEDGAQEMARKGGVTSVEIQDERVTGEEAEVMLVINYPRASDAMLVNLVREGDAWKVADWSRR